MKALVRDDIIALNSFVLAEFKYRPYLEMLMKAGSYCFLDQFKKLIPKGDSIIKGMIENNLIATENINKNYKYIYLTDTGMKYLYLRDSKIDFSEVDKNKISVKKVNKYPSEKQLLSSAYKFHLIAVGEEMIDKESILNAVEDYVFKNTVYKTYSYFNELIEKINIRILELKGVIDGFNNKKADLVNTISIINKEADLFDFYSEESTFRYLKDKLNEIANVIKQKEAQLIKVGLNEKKQELRYLQKATDQVEKIISIKRKANSNYKMAIEEIETNILKLNRELEDYEDKKCKMERMFEANIKPNIKKVQAIFKKVFDISKVILRINNDVLEFIIFDNGNFKTANGYMKIIRSIKELGLSWNSVRIIIYSYCERRALNLESEFLKLEKEKEKARKIMDKYNNKKHKSILEFERKPDFYLVAEEIYTNIPNFKIEIKPDFYYMAKYKEFIDNRGAIIKRKDKKVMDELINKLKINS